MKRFWIGLLNGLLCLLVCAALALAGLLACDWLYRADVRLLDIPARSGLAENVILENYHAAVQYLLPWNDAPLELRGLPWSAAGSEYFRRLRICVLCVYMLGMMGGIGLILLHGRRKKLGRKVWNVSGTVTLGLTAALGVLLALDFARLQTAVCNALFGDSWLLYEDLDPIVTIFPQSFFVHAAFFVVFVCVAGSLLQFAAGYTAAPPQKADDATRGAEALQSVRRRSARAAERPARPKPKERTRPAESPGPAARAKAAPRSGAPAPAAQKQVFRRGK